jgi:hypothetical protein
MGQSSLHPPQNETGQKQGSRWPKDGRNSELLGHETRKSKTRQIRHSKTRKGGYHAPLQSACFPCFSILVACIWALPGVTKRSPAGTRSELEKGPNRISARQGRRLRRTAFWNKGAKNHLQSRESNCRYPKHRKARYTRNWRP